MRNVSLRNLRVFEAAASTQSFSRVGELLGMTQSAVSQQVRQLEEEAGARLFDTHARPIRLTAAGDALLRHARAILAQVALAQDALGTLAGEFSGQLHVGVVSPAQHFMPALLAGFSAQHPDVRLKLSVDRRDPLLALLAERRIDLMVGGYPPSEAEVQAEVFARHPHVIVAPPEHPLAGARALAWSQLAPHRFVFREAGSSTRSFLEHLMLQQQVSPRVGVEVQGAEAVVQAVASGLGLSFVSAHTIQHALAAQRLVVLDVVGMPKQLDWCLLHARDQALSPEQALFREFVLAEGTRLAACQLGTTVPMAGAA